MDKIQQTNIQEEQVDFSYAPLTVKSPVFSDGGFLPLQYTCDGANFNPSLDIGGIPKGAKSLAIIMEDPDAPGGRFIHWLAWNIPVIRHIKEARSMEAEGLNNFKVHSYKGPCPSFGTHHYHFQVYALDRSMDLPQGCTEEALRTAMKGHILGYGGITGLYKRK
jgi:Raf kinase inhibitor-like YbhB/YbcL family protein